MQQKCSKMQNTDATKCGLMHRISKSISCHCVSLCTKLPRKMCKMLHKLVGKMCRACQYLLRKM